MAYIRTCPGNDLFTGKSVCDIDYSRIRFVILTEHGVKLDYSTGEALRTACHADVPERAYGFPKVYNWETSGGDAATSAVGYGPTRFAGLNTRTDTFTLEHFYHWLRAQILKNVNRVFDMYLIDKTNKIYGLNDGEDVLAGIPVTIYPSGNDHADSSDPASLRLNVVYEDVEDYVLNLDVQELGYRAEPYVYGLMPVTFVSTDDGYKLIEYYGKADATAKYGQLIADNASKVLNNVTAATYDSETKTLTISGDEVTLKSTATLAENGIYGIEQYEA